MTPQEEIKFFDYGFALEDMASSLTKGGSGNWIESFNDYYTPGA